MKAKAWKKLASTEVLRHPRIHLIEDTVELPNGNTATYLRHSPAKTHSVAIIAINDRQEVLIQKEYSYPPNEIMWQLPGGGMREGEDVVTAANRELSEESDLTASNCKEIGFYYVDNRRSDSKQYVVLCTGLKRQVGQEDDEEFIETHWMSLAKLRSMIKAGEIHNSFLLAALNLYLTQVNS